MKSSPLSRNTNTVRSKRSHPCELQEIKSNAQFQVSNAKLSPLLLKNFSTNRKLVNYECSVITSCRLKKLAFKHLACHKQNVDKWKDADSTLNSLPHWHHPHSEKEL